MGRGHTGRSYFCVCAGRALCLLYFLFFPFLEGESYSHFLFRASASPQSQLHVRNRSHAGVCPTSDQLWVGLSRLWGIPGRMSNVGQDWAETLDFYKGGRGAGGGNREGSE